MIDATIHRLRDALREADGGTIAELAATLHAADWADLVHHLDDTELQQLMQSLPDATVSAVLAELSPLAAARILPGMSHSRAVSLLEQLSPDDATDVLQELPDASVTHLLTGMNPEDAGVIRLLLNWPEDSAGSLMTPEFVAIQPEIRADQAIRALRELAAEAELANYVYVLDRDDVLLGVLSLRNLLLAPADAQVRQLMITPVLSVEAGSDQRVAVNLLRDRSLLALPVTDGEHRLLGVITHDDAAEVLEAELVDDYMKLAGTDAEEMERRSPWQIARLRVPWLLGTMVIELGAGLVIHRFDDVLQRVILLAAFMPVISAVSGNVGLQSAAIVVRGLDTGQVAISDWQRHVRRELAATLMMAVLCGGALGAIGIAWSGHVAFGMVIGCALTCSMVTAGMMGSIIPMVSKRLGFDPATTAGPFETAFQDVVGFAVFLWLASLMITLID